MWINVYRHAICDTENNGEINEEMKKAMKKRENEGTEVDTLGRKKITNPWRKGRKNERNNEEKERRKGVANEPNNEGKKELNK